MAIMSDVSLKPDASPPAVPPSPESRLRPRGCQGSENHDARTRNHRRPHDDGPKRSSLPDASPEARTRRPLGALVRSGIRSHPLHDYPMPFAEPDLRRTWLFGPGADVEAHDAMERSGADALIVDLEDFTPPARRDEARRGLAILLQHWRDA